MSRFSLWRAAFATLAASLAVIGCSAKEEVAPLPLAKNGEPISVNPVSYQCGDKQVHVSDMGERVYLYFEDPKKVFALDAVVSASGAKYGTGGNVFWSKGDRALLIWDGVEYPECVEKGAVAEASGGDILKAHGNEPGWLLELGGATFRFTGDYGAIVLGGTTPAAETLSDGVLYTIADQNLSIRLYDRLCHDDSTGALFPKAVTVTLGDKVYKGCGGDPAGVIIGEWTITHLAGAAVVANSPATILFDDQGRVSGNASCNRYSGEYTLAAEGFKADKMVATEMACLDPALMDQERRLLDNLQAADRLDIDEGGALVLYTRDQETIRARR